MESEFKYCAVIRTLGTAGAKYQQLLDSLNNQSIKPTKIVVYIAEGYKIPKETIGWEEYVFVKKGMVRQRALAYDEVDTEYILFLDDDLCFPSDTVEKMRDFLVRENADIIAPDIFPNAHRSILSQILMTFSGRMYARHKKNDCWGYKVLRNSGYSYNSKPIRDTYRSQTNAGACFLCSKQKFLDIHFEEELWMDEVEYSLGDDQVMYYKMYLMGLKQLTWYTHHFIHLDAGQNMCPLKKKKIIYSDFRFKVIFWHRFIFKPEQFLLFRLLDIFCISYFFMLSLMISIFKGELDIFKVKLKALLNGINYLRSSQYHSLPIVRKNLT